MSLSRYCFNQVIKLVIVLLSLLVILYFYTTSFASAESSSGVVEELQKDPDFKKSDYPSKGYLTIKNSTKKYLEIIQVAETTNDKLVLYVYQPTDANLEIVATHVSLSTGIGDDLHPYRYKLKLIDTNGVFDKYLVEDFTLLNEDVRYYEIPAIYFPYNEKLGGNPESFESTTESSVEVGKRFKVETIDGELVYECIEVDTILIENMYPFFHRKKNLRDYIFGFLPFAGSVNVDFQCVAFNTNIDMDHIIEVEMEYKKVNYTQPAFDIIEVLYWDIWTIEGDREYEIPKENVKATHKTLTDKEFISADSDYDFYWGTYDWKEICSTSEFLNSNKDLDSNAQKFLNDYNWVLCFDYTEYVKNDTTVYTFSSGTEVFDVVLLRFKFEKEGQTYNLGAVSDVKTSSKNPINDDFSDNDDDGTLDKIVEILKLVLIIFLGVLLIPILIPIINLLVMVITLPFKLLKSIFRSRK